MKVGDKHYYSLWFNNDKNPEVYIIDQRLLPFRFETRELATLNDSVWAINEMAVRGAPLIGVTAAFGLFLASKSFSKTNYSNDLHDAVKRLIATRPTAVNLARAVKLSHLRAQSSRSLSKLRDTLLQSAIDLWNDEKDSCKRIGEYGVGLIESAYKKKGDVVNILTHCNAGWLACVDYGTATAPIYEAQRRGIPVHVWVDETRPRNQGAFLTAWEMKQQGIPHTVIVDNAGGLLMQQKSVDLCIVGSDRTSAQGDVANKIGTYLKALAAFDNDIPFYVALPTSTIDPEVTDAFNGIPIEERSPQEVSHISGWTPEGVKPVQIIPEGSAVHNPGFDITPGRLVSALITEKGICPADSEGIRKILSKN